MAWGHGDEEVALAEGAFLEGVKGFDEFLVERSHAVLGVDGADEATEGLRGFVDQEETLGC
jgi:hypothetical protein